MGIMCIEAHFPNGAPSERTFQQHLHAAYKACYGYEFFAEGEEVTVELALPLSLVWWGRPSRFLSMYIKRVLMDLGGTLLAYPPELPRECLLPAFIEQPWQSFSLRQKLWLYFHTSHPLIRTAVFEHSPPNEQSFRAELARLWGCHKHLVYYQVQRNRLILVAHGEFAAQEYIERMIYEKGGHFLWPGTNEPMPIPMTPASFTRRKWSDWSLWQQWRIRIRRMIGLSV